MPNHKLKAQNIVCKKQGVVKCENVLSNEALIVFVSQTSGWVVEPVMKQNIKDTPKGVIPQATGFRYEFVADVSMDNERTFNITRKGSPMRKILAVKGLARGTQVTYSVEEEIDSLGRIELQPNGNVSSYPKAGLALIEISSTISQLEINTPWEVKEIKNEAGARVISVIVNVAELQNCKSKIDSLALIVENGNFDEAMLKANDQKEQLEQWYLPRTVITLGGNGIKELPLELSDLHEKELRRYAALALQEDFNDLLQRARSMKAARSNHLDYGFYHAMISAYDQAIGHKDAPIAELESLQIERNEMAMLRKLIWQLDRADELAKEAEKQQGFESERVYKCLNARLNVTKQLIQEFPELQGVREVQRELEVSLRRHPHYYNHTEVVEVKQRQVITGTVEAGNNFYHDIANLAIYRVEYSGKIRSDSSKKLIGRVNADGTFKVVLPENTSYILFEGEKHSRYISETDTDLGTIELK